MRVTWKTYISTRNIQYLRLEKKIYITFTNEEVLQELRKILIKQYQNNKTIAYLKNITKTNSHKYF